MTLSGSQCPRNSGETWEGKHGTHSTREVPELEVCLSFTRGTLEMGAREEGLWGLDPWFSVTPSLTDRNLESPSASAFPDCKENQRVRPHKEAGG